MTLPPGMLTDLEFAEGVAAPGGADPVDVVREVRAVSGLLDGPVLPDVAGGWAERGLAGSRWRRDVSGCRQ